MSHNRFQGPGADPAPVHRESDAYPLTDRAEIEAARRALDDLEAAERASAELTLAIGGHLVEFHELGPEQFASHDQYEFHCRLLEED